MTPNARQSTLRRLESDTFDVAIIGGGITGAWIALHCCTLGYRTALVDRGDFGAETSAASSKLLHGGIRYLQQLQFNKVRESSLERAEYLNAAPHLSNPIPFVVPTYNDLKRSKFLLRCGIWAYQLLGLGQNRIAKLRNHSGLAVKQFSTEELNSLCDLAHLGHTGAIAFPEFHMHDSERTVWSVLESAIADGCVAANYVTVTDIVIDDKKATGVMATVTGSGQVFKINSSLVINAAGPWVDTINCQNFKSNRPLVNAPLIQNYAAGAHVITRQLTNGHAIAITTRQKSVAAIDRGGRHIFIIPWRGYSLIGTSYRETEDPNSAETLDKEDLNQLLQAVNETLPSAQLCAEDIISAYVGLYPLRTNTQLKATYQGSGEYILVDHDAEYGIRGLITSLGAKFTTGRILAEKTAILARNKLSAPPTAGSQVLRRKLNSSQYSDLHQFTQEMQAKYGHRFSAQTTEHLINAYGSHMESFIEFIDQQVNSELLQEPISEGQPDVLGQVAWAVDREMAIQLDDVLLRRTSLGLLGISEKQITTVATLMASKLAWSQEHLEAQIQKAVSRQQKIRDVANEFYREQ